MTVERTRERPLTIAILALGGQGGGVLTGWLVEAAKSSGYLAQSTFVAGVAQRTGATIYCVEMFPRDRAAALGKEPVFTAYPVPGDVDLVIAGEMAETGRAIQKGFVTPNVTTLVASSHRVYSIDEKSALGDGIVDQRPVAEIASRAAKKFVCFDMQEIADETGSVISSVLLGAIAATGALPIERAAFEDAIRQAGRAVAANLEGFARGFEKGAGRAAPRAAAPLEKAMPAGPAGRALAEQIAETLPAPVAELALHGALRALDFQDIAYAHMYLDRIAEIVKRDRAAGGDEQQYALSAECARQLALQMCYEDTIRVAELKTRAERHSRIRGQLAATHDQPMYVSEYFHPRVEEVCDTLPAALAARVLGSPGMRRLFGKLFSKGRIIRTTKLSGFLMLRTLASMRRWRRGTYRFALQQQRIGDWLSCVHEALDQDYDYALSVARSIEIVKGYGDTYERGLTRYLRSIDAVRQLPPGQRAAAMQKLHNAALADEQGRAFEQTLDSLGAAA
ncbi:MAG: indolepyruvate oxidoreductase subunit beta family protein [Gammaproteobacteria bacterium]|nr:indolepyruvate oxidoreductase subunit beta family protein [Gammaproteobacteria bacterium]